MGQEVVLYAAELVLDEELDEFDDEDEPDDEEPDELDDESEDDDEEAAVDGFDAGALLDEEPRLSLR